MPSGLTHVPAVLKALLNYMLWDMLNKFVLVYLNYTLIFSKTEQEHVQCVLQRLLENQLFEKAEKCEFHVS